MLVRWVATVRREMNIRSAICGLDRPSATVRATVSSVGVRLAQPVPGAGACRGRGWRMRLRLPASWLRPRPTPGTGEPGVDAAYGMGLFEFLALHPEHAINFDAAMSERTAGFAPSLAAGYDFSQFRTLADIGGGRGALLAAVLRAHRQLHGVLLETSAVAAGAAAVLHAAGLADRWQVVVGDFFESVPDGADAYLMANVLHDWDDARAVRILASCRRAMAPDGRVLIVERLIPDDPAEAIPTLLSDFNMLVLTGGRERTNAEYGELLAAADLRAGAIVPVAFPYGVIEGFAS